MENNSERKKYFKRTQLLDKKDVERAMKNTKSNKAAARYLGIDYKTYKNLASSYTNEEGKTYYQLHMNQSGKGVPKYANRKSRGALLMEILEGTVNTTLISMKEVKYRLITEGYIREECSRCRYHEKRVLDERVPLIVNYVDGNKRNWRLENLELLCYNCYFIHIGDVFQKKQLDALEDYKVINATSPDFDLPKIYQKEVIKATGMDNVYFQEEDKPDNFGDDLIATKIKR